MKKPDDLETQVTRLRDDIFFKARHVLLCLNSKGKNSGGMSNLEAKYYRAIDLKNAIGDLRAIASYKDLPAFANLVLNMANQAEEISHKAFDKYSELVKKYGDPSESDEIAEKIHLEIKEYLKVLNAECRDRHRQELNKAWSEFKESLIALSENANHDEFFRSYKCLRIAVQIIGYDNYEDTEYQSSEVYKAARFFTIDDTLADQYQFHNDGYKGKLTADVIANLQRLLATKLSESSTVGRREDEEPRPAKQKQTENQSFTNRFNAFRAEHRVLVDGSLALGVAIAATVMWELKYPRQRP